MPKFYEKNGNCMEKKNYLQVDPNNEVMWISYEVKGETKNHFKISDNKWKSAIAQENTMIIIDKNIKSMYILV